MNLVRVIAGILGIILWWSSVSQAQVVENFDGPEFNTSGLWMGTTTHFIINAEKQAILNAPAAGRSYFSTIVNYTDSMQLQCFLKLNFSPSTQNYLEICLQSDSASLKGKNAILLRIGETGSNDGIQLIAVVDGMETLLARGGDGVFATKPAGTLTCNIIDHLITITFTDLSNTTIPILETEVPTWSTGEDTYFGCSMEYTVSNIKNYTFDNIYINRIIRDTKPPELVSSTVDIDSRITLVFDEPLATLDTSNFLLLNLMGNQVPFEDISTQDNIISLFPANPLIPNQPYFLIIKDISDKVGNILIKTQIKVILSLQTIHPFDVLINEIMADPTPQVALPNAEFIELYNRSDSPINLNQLQLLKETTAIALPAYELSADSYVILTSTGSLPLFSAYSNAIGVPSFPSINNTGNSFSIKSTSGTVIHMVSFTDKSYRDDTKKDGGWTLELSGEGALCLQDPFKASINLSGGTPGRVNSLNSTELDLPLVRSYYTDSLGSLQICFNETLDFDAAATRSAFSNDQNLNYNLVTTGISSCAELKFVENPPANQLNCIYIDQPVNCIGSVLYKMDTICFGRFEAPAPGELLINEILFDPLTGGSDYVEILNTGERIIDLAPLSIRNTQKSEAVSIGRNIYIQPKELVVFTADRDFILAQYVVPKPTNLVQLTKLPAFNQDKGNVSLFYGNDAAAILLDSMDYDQKMHNSFIKNTKGISLERLSPALSSTDRSTWQSASTSLKGTPTGQNSQTRNISANTSILDVQQEYLSPNGDGYLDQLLVGYQLDKGGYKLTWRVYDARGRQVKSNGQTELTGASGYFVWEGDNDQNQKVMAGIYIIEVSFLHPDGSIRKDKTSIVVSYPD